MNQYILNGSAYLELGEVVGVVALPSPTAFYVDNKTYLLLESQTGFVKGLFYKCREVTPATDPKTYEWYVVNDEIGSLPTKIMDIWKSQNSLGAKNLIHYPYISGTSVQDGITYTANSDGSITVNGTVSEGKYPTYPLWESNENILPYGQYILSTKERLPQGVVIRIQHKGDSSNIARLDSTMDSVEFTINDNMAQKLNITVISNTTVDNVTVYPMIRLASDPDDTWTPYAPTNKELYEMVRALQSGTTATTNRGGDENSDS